MHHDSTSSPRSTETVYAQSALDFLSAVEQREMRPHLARRKRLKTLYAARMRQQTTFADDHPVVIRKRRQHRTWNGEVINLDRALHVYGHRCYLCDTVLRRGVGAIHLDHVVPLSRGGGHTLANIRPACPDCNWVKQNRLWHELTDSHPKMARRVRAIVEDAA